MTSPTSSSNAQAWGDVMAADLAASNAAPNHPPSPPDASRHVGIRNPHNHHLRLVSAQTAGLTGERSEVAPQSCFFICHTLRCGSTLLSDALSSTGLAGNPEEYFPERTRDGRLSLATVVALKDPDTWRSDWTHTPFDECLQRVLQSGTSPNGVFASKLKWVNLPFLSEALGPVAAQGDRSLAGRLDELFPDLRYVWVMRRDKVRQAVSLAKARQSSQWKAMSVPAQHSGGLEYNFHVIDVALRRIVHEECAWAEYFTRAGITPLTVVYEDLVRNYESVVRRLLGDLQISLPSDYVFPAPRIYKQADAISEDWVERYQRDAQRSRTVRTVANLPALVVKRRLRETYVTPRLQSRIGRLPLVRRLAP